VLVLASHRFGSKADIAVNLSPDAWKIIQDYVARDSTAFAFYELAST